MASNSIAPSKKALDLYLDGADWKLSLFAPDGITQISTGAVVGRVTLGTNGVVSFPLSLRDLGGDAAHELRIFGADEIKLIHVSPASEAFPVAGLTVATGEVVAHQVESIVEIGAGITRVSIAWGG